ncbi:hypothetical protein PsorP6_015404 [Peronosclerospora sorghi]|uniref:Uncharacterized protein n=1 Tax=Peronosclerospora sorghi TaxID=230839 RepID=A0ACC0WN90_9STRA|nr:hypothetical protein PsorP6_015404 [Peronosclerospora sorghi]
MSISCIQCQGDHGRPNEIVLADSSVIKHLRDKKSFLPLIELELKVFGKKRRLGIEEKARLSE